MKIVITRHGQTAWNFESKHKFQGLTDVELSEVGREQSVKLANRLKDMSFDVVYCSPLKRAYDTANEVLKNFSDVDLVVLDDLKEFDFGIFEGFTKNEVISKYSDIWTEREKDKMNYKIPKGESLNDVQVRANRVLDKIFAGGKDVLIVAHATINMFFFMRLLDKSFKEINLVYYNNCEVSIFDIDLDSCCGDVKVNVELFSCSKHLN